MPLGGSLNISQSRLSGQNYVPATRRPVVLIPVAFRLRRSFCFRTGRAAARPPLSIHPLIHKSGCVYLCPLAIETLQC